MKKLQNLVHFLLQLLQETVCHQLSPLKRTQTLTFFQRPEFQHVLIFFHSLLQWPPGTMTNLICIAVGSLDVPVNRKKMNVACFVGQVRMLTCWTLKQTLRTYIYQMKVHGVGADVIRIWNISTTRHLSVKILKAWKGSSTAYRNPMCTH